MATTATAVSSKLALIVETGTTSGGKKITATRSISSINPELTDDNARTFATMLGALQKYPVDTIQRTVVSELSASA